MQHPLVTVLLPVYNCEKYIAAAVQSILEQTYTHFELFIIDDCSTDKTVAICKSFTDERITIIEKETNSGLTESLNYGLSIANGKYIARMDGDDISFTNRFEKQVAFLETNEDVVVCGAWIQIIDTNEIVDYFENHDLIKVGLLEDCKLAHPTVMMRTSVFKENEIFYNTKMDYAEDYDLWVRLSSIGKLHNLQESLLYYRKHEGQVSSTRNEVQVKHSNLIKLNFLTSFYPEINTLEKTIYIKIISNFKLLTFNEFYSYLDLKNKLLSQNSNFTFDKDIFKNFLTRLESQYVNYYFRNSKNYSLLMLKQYFKSFLKLTNKMSFLNTCRFIFKCCIYYKSK